MFVSSHYHSLCICKAKEKTSACIWSNAGVLQGKSTSTHLDLSHPLSLPFSPIPQNHQSRVRSSRFDGVFVMYRERLSERGREQGRLDSTSRTATVTSLTAASAGKAGDDNIEETNNGADDCLEDCANAVDNCHEAGSDGLEDRLDLLFKLVTRFSPVMDIGMGKVTYARYDGTHFESCCAERLVVCVFGL